MTVLNIIRDCLDALLHPSARYDALTSARHRAFMAPRLLGSLAAFAAFPVYLAMRGAPTALEVAAFAWLIAPILLSWFLSRTGRYEGAHVLSSLALAGLVMTVAMTTGGIESFAAIWLVVVPLEAALSASRRVVAFASRAGAGMHRAADRVRAFRPVAAAGCQCGLARRLHGVRRGIGDALCGRACLRRRVAGAHQRRAALCRGGSLSPAGAQHERRDFASSPQRRRAVHFAGGGRRCWGRRCRGCWGTACSTASTSPIVRPISPRFRTRRAAARRAASNFVCGGKCRAAARGARTVGRFHLGRNALPAARTGVGMPLARGRSRGRRRDARRHRPQDRRSRRSIWRAPPPSRPMRRRPASSPP